jgi:[acyl-carrier-protein] S-malonyltransferase
VAEVANYNSPTQTVISGEEQPIKAAMELAKQRGAERVVQLNVSAPFHCSLMAPLAEAFQPVLGRETIRDSQIPVMANVTANWERTADEIRTNLVEQLDSSVRWTDSMQRMIDDGFDTFIEVGPGRVLTGLMRAINPDISVFNTNNPGSLDQAVTGASG